MMIKTGTDALTFLKQIPDHIWDTIDTVNWDPPYFDSDNPKDVERVNQRSKLKDTKVKFTKLVRACAKPIELYKNLYRHLDSKIILDPFAGWGGSIFAAIELDLQIYACDIDSSLDWAHSQQQSLQRDW